MKLLIAGGGTGGHLFPGIAVAEEFLARSSENRVLFVGTRKGIEAKVLPDKGYPVSFVHIEGWHGKSIFQKLKTLFLIPLSLIQAFKIVSQFKPDRVLGIGGYASFPVLCAALLLRKKTAIQEQNLRPGTTNRILSKWVDRIFVNFQASTSFFPEEKVMVSGNPIRKMNTNVERSEDKFTVFIFGGSQGAHSLNRAMLEAISFLGDVKDKIKIIHQVGHHDLEWVSSTYFENRWEVETFDFTSEIDRILARADYVICRSGAGSLSELSMLKKACLLVPYPHAAHNHQEQQARLMEQRQAARVILDWQLTGQKLADEIQWALSHPRELEELRKNIVQFSKPYAAKTIVDMLVTQ